MIEAVKRLPVTPTQKLVLFCLADCHNDQSGCCNPSVAYIETVSGLSDRAIQTAIKQLIDCGIIGREAPRGKTPNYTFPTPEAASPHPRTSFTPPPKEVRQTPEAASPKPVLTGIEPEGTSSGESAPPPADDDLQKPGKAKTPKPSEADPRHAAFIAAFFDAYQAETGEKYLFNSREGRTLQKFLARLPTLKVEQMMTVLQWTWARAKQPFAAKHHTAGTIHEFLTHWQRLVMERKQASQQRPKHRAYDAQTATDGLTQEQILNF